MKASCGQHPAWSVSGANKSGRSPGFSFAATTFAAGATSPFGLQNVSPTPYAVSVDSCRGGRSVQVEAYPPGAVSFKLDVTTLLEKIATVLKYLPVEPETTEKWKRSFLQGSAKYSGGWKEDKASWKAYYDKSWTLGFSPLASISHKGPVYPLTLVPGWLQKWVKAGVFYKIGLSSSVSGTIAGAWWPTEGQNRWATRDISGGGSATAALSLEMKLVSKDVVEGSIVGDTGLGIKAKLGVGDDPTLELNWSFQGIGGSASIKAIWGIVEFTRKFDLVGPRTLKSEWALGEQDAGD
jgi:hypothetical protein